LLWVLTIGSATTTEYVLLILLLVLLLLILVATLLLPRLLLSGLLLRGLLSRRLLRRWIIYVYRRSSLNDWPTTGGATALRASTLRFS
jgi:hypothetical protein